MQLFKIEEYQMEKNNNNDNYRDPEMNPHTEGGQVLLAPSLGWRCHLCLMFCKLNAHKGLSKITFVSIFSFSLASMTCFDREPLRKNKNKIKKMYNI